MNYELKTNAFSLTEVLLAVGALAVGMIFIAGVFPVAIHFATIATERTIAAVVADEAFAKIRLYAVGDPEKGNDDIDLGEFKYDELTDFNDALNPAVIDVNSSDFVYPSTGTGISRKQYSWSALCRLTEDGTTNNLNPPVQVTVFVCRKTNPNLKYYGRDPSGSGEVKWPSFDEVDWPMPVKVEVSSDVSGEDNELWIDETRERIFINDGYTIVDNETGQLYRVLERYTPEDNTILLDRDWDPDGNPPDKVWVVPPPANGGRYPCIAIYQKVIRF